MRSDKATQRVIDDGVVTFDLVLRKRSPVLLYFRAILSEGSDKIGDPWDLARTVIWDIVQ